MSDTYKGQGPQYHDGLKLVGNERPGLVFTETDRKLASMALQECQRGEEPSKDVLNRLDELRRAGSHSAAYMLEQVARRLNPEVTRAADHYQQAKEALNQAGQAFTVATERFLTAYSNVPQEQQDSLVSDVPNVNEALRTANNGYGARDFTFQTKDNT